jgi:hypothetical protein
MWQYFVREPDLDPYREHAEFKKLMAAHAPKASIEDKAPAPGK